MYREYDKRYLRIDSGNQYLLTGNSGNFYLTTNPNNFISSGDFTTSTGQLGTRIENTGTAIQNQIIGFVPSGNLPFFNLDNYSSINTAVSAIGTKKATLVVPSSGNVATDVIIPSNVNLFFTNSGVFNINSGVTLSIYGDIISPNKQIFSNIHTGLNKGILDFSNNKSINKFMIPWWGAPNNNLSDAQPILQEMVNTATRNMTLYAPLNQYYLLNNTLRLSGQRGLGFISDIPREASTTQASILTWNGAAGGTVLDMNVCEYCRVEGWTIDCGGTGGADRGINIDGENASTISTDNTIAHNRIFGSTRTGFRGITIAETATNNNEFMKIIHNNITCYQGTGIGLYLGQSSNAHGHHLIDNNFYSLRYGIKGDAAGFIMDGINNFGSNEIDINIGQTCWPLVIKNCDTENSDQFIRIAYNADDPIVIENNRIGTAYKRVAEYGASARYITFRNNRISFAPIIHQVSGATQLRLFSYNNVHSAEETGVFYNFGTSNLYTDVQEGYLTSHIIVASGSTNIAPLKFITGDLTTPVQAGAMEWDGTKLYITQSTGSANPYRQEIVTTTNTNSILTTLDDVFNYNNDFYFDFGSGFYRDVFAFNPYSAVSFLLDVSIVQGNTQTNAEKYFIPGGIDDYQSSTTYQVLPAYSTLYRDPTNPFTGNGGGLYDLLSVKTGSARMLRMRSLTSGFRADSLFNISVTSYGVALSGFFPSSTGIDTGNYAVYDNTLLTQGDGKVGIGIRFPRYALDVIGEGRFSAGLLVSGNSVVTGGPYYLASNPNNFGSTQNVITGFGTTGYIPKFTANGSGLIHSIIYESGSKVGIGTILLDSPLVVDGGVSMTNGWIRNTTLGATYPVLVFSSTVTPKWAGIGYDSSDGLSFFVNASSNDVSAGTQALKITNAGGIVLSSAATLGVGGTPGGRFAARAIGNFSSAADFAANSAAFFTYYLSDVYGLAVGVNASIPALQSLDTNAAYQLAINPYGGNICIGKTSPTSNLDINGHLLAKNITGSNIEASVSLKVSGESVVTGLERLYLKSDFSTGLFVDRVTNQIISGQKTFIHSIVANDNITGLSLDSNTRILSTNLNSVDWGFVSESVDSSEDYGLITSSVSESEDWGGQTNNISIDWGNHIGYGKDALGSIDYGNRALSGTWNTQSLKINSGYNINSDGNLNLVSNNVNTGIILSGSRLCLYGDTSGSAPSTNTLTVPVSIPVYGDIDKLCGNPNGFLMFNLSGRAVKIPYYY